MAKLNRDCTACTPKIFPLWSFTDQHLPTPQVALGCKKGEQNPLPGCNAHVGAPVLLPAPADTSNRRLSCLLTQPPVAPARWWKLTPERKTMSSLSYGSKVESRWQKEKLKGDFLTQKAGVEPDFGVPETCIIWKQILNSESTLTAGPQKGPVHRGG